MKGSALSQDRRARKRRRYRRRRPRASRPWPRRRETRRRIARGDVATDPSSSMRCNSSTVPPLSGAIERDALASSSAARFRRCRIALNGRRRPRHPRAKKPSKTVLCRGPESNWRHMVLQTIALPTELPRRETQFYRSCSGTRTRPTCDLERVLDQWSNELISTT